jgi:ATP adenylyltransferase
MSPPYQVEPLGQEVNFIRKQLAKIDLQGVVPLGFERVRPVERDSSLFHLGIIKNLDSKISSLRSQTSNPFLPPFEPGLHICDIMDSHRLLKNKFQAVSNHLLLITQRYECQATNPLTERDLMLGMVVVKALGKNGLLFFNCGKDSGYSQAHKHLQILPANQYMYLPTHIKQHIQTLPDSPEPFKFPGFRFRHGIFAVNLAGDKEEVGRYLKARHDLLREKVVREGESYNLVMTQEFMLIVPRKQERAFNMFSLNGLAFTGTIGVRHEDAYEKACQLSLHELLGEITFP